MLKFKDGKSEEQVVDEILRSYLLRCYTTVSKQYQPIEDMSPEQGVEYLFELRNEGRIRISLNSVGERIECTINLVN
jgi:hypothetical protein